MLAAFFTSPAGMFVAQSFCHSLIASLVMDQAVRAWQIESPVVRQRFRLVAVLFPLFSFPLFQLINPDRGSVLFRFGSLFDVNRWLNVEPWGIFPLSVPFLVVLGLTSLIFLLQEMIPIIRHSLESRTIEHEGARRDPDPFIEASARALSINPPDVFIVEDDDPVIFSSTSSSPAIYLSTGLTSALTPDEMQAALAHEMGHIARSRRPVMLVVFFLRMILFFNPVALIEFRRVIRNEEKICDDIAVSLTKRPSALANALRKFYTKREEPEPENQPKPLIKPVPIEEYSYNIQLEGRITRLESGGTDPHNGRWLPFFLAVFAVTGLTYFVV